MQPADVYRTVTSLFAQGTLPPWAAPDSTVGLSLLAAAIGMAIWFLVLLRTSAGKEGRFRVEVNFQKQHYIQACCHLGIYFYLALYWPGVRNYAPLIAAQIVFAYFFEMLLSWSGGRVWQLRLGPFPIVFSINLFMWFREPYFYLQLLLIAFTYLSKEYLTWTWNGRKRHIFNPSGISLTIVGLILLSTKTNGILTYGIDLTTSFYLPPNLYEVIFLLGLIVMFMFSTTLITFGSFLALTALHWVAPVAPAPIDVYVLLGLTFLLTDPSTSPRNNWGKFLFGLAYGIGIFAAYAILRQIQQPSYFDKLFPVPILNLLAPRFEAMGERIERLLYRPWLPALRYQWAVYLAMYVGLFVGILPQCKSTPPDFVSPFPAATEFNSPQLTELRIKRRVVREFIYPEAFKPFGFRQEIAHLSDMRDFQPRTALECDSLGILLSKEGANERALSYFRQALEFDRSFASAHLHLGIVFMGQGQLDAALDHLRRALALEPQDGNMHFVLGLALEKQGQPESALEHLQQAVNLSPSNANACLELANALTRSGRLEEAVPYLRQASEIMRQDRKLR